MRSSRLLWLALFTACASPAAPAAPTEPGADLPLGQVVAPFHPAVLRARRLPDTFDASTLVPRLPTDPNVDTLRLALFEDAVFDVEVSHLDQSADRTVVRGLLMGHPEASVTLAITQEALAGTVRVGSHLYSIVPRSGRTLVVEWDEAAAPSDAPPRIDDIPRGPSVRRAVASAADSEAPVVDVLVATTAAAVRGAGGRDAMRAIVELAMAETNQSLEASGVPGRFALVGTVETDYDETDFDFDEAIQRLATPSDGFMDDVPTARDELGADQVVLLVDSVTRYAGTGFQMTALNAPGFAPFAYSVVSRDYATGHYTFAHELGHNLGAQHDPANAGAGYRDDARGHQAREAGFRTLMAYSCGDVSCRRVARWSNPDARHDGVETGVHGVSNNAATLRLTMPIAAGYRTRAPVAPPPAAIVTSPAPGSTLDAGPLQLVWTDVAADAYHVTVGATPGDATWGRASVGTGTTATFEAPPAEGQPVFVRLWSSHAGVWRHTEARFTAPAPAFEGASVSLPTPGEPLTSTWLWFSWPEVAGASEYRLRVGTERHPDALLDQTLPGRWAMVTGLPIDGSAVRVSLSTRGPDGWVERVTRYEGWRAPPHVSAITAPANGRTLAGRSVRVRWTDASDAARWLVIRDDEGLVRSTPVEGPFVDVSDLPLDGRRLYAALYSEAGDSWTPAVVSWIAASEAR